MFFKTGQISLDRVLDICDRLFARFSFRDTTRQRRTFGDEHAILVGFDQDSVLHRRIVGRSILKINY